MFAGVNHHWVITDMRVQAKNSPLTEINDELSLAESRAEHRHVSLQGGLHGLDSLHALLCTLSVLLCTNQCQSLHIYKIRKPTTY